jgi:hypothetical protein
MRETPRLYTQKEVDEARKQGYEIAEALYSSVIKRMKEEKR